MFYKFCSELIPTDLYKVREISVGDLFIQIIVMLFDNMCNFTPQISKSFSLLY